MQLFTDVKQKTAEFAKDNATTLLTAGGVVGTIGTAVLAWRGGYKYAKVETTKQMEILDDWKCGPHSAEHTDTKPEDIVVPKKEMLVATVTDQIPLVITGTATITAIIMSNRMSAQKAAALAAAYGLAERNFSDYRAKIEEKLTGPKKTAITDELAQDAVNKTPGSEKIVIVEGEVLCFDKATGRYFNSSVERIRQSMNTTNAEIFNHGFTTVNFFYSELGLPSTTWASEVGFDGDNVLDLEFSTLMAPGNRPCVAIDFRSMPRTESSGPKYG